MTWFPIRSVRARLWSALALLSFAVLSISAFTWLSLGWVDDRLEQLHRQTLTQVAQALKLSKQSTDLATSAPYLLNQRSNFLIDQEGQKLIAALDKVRVEWPSKVLGEANPQEEIVAGAVERLTSGVKDLIAASSSLDDVQTDLRALTSQLGSLRAQASAMIDDPLVDDSQRLIWWKLQSMASDALNAAFAGNLIGVGEAQRQLLGQRNSLPLSGMTPVQTEFLNSLDKIVRGDAGIFEQRRRELAIALSAQNALFRIRYDAGLISATASDFALTSEAFLANERTSSSSVIQVTKFVVFAIALASLVLALLSAIYVSRYVTFNMARISSAMVRLADGDLSSSLPRKTTNDDEIGDLFRSFRSFRANALRLDRSNTQLDRQNALFQKVFTNISDGIAITDMSGRITAQNPAMIKIFEASQNPSDATTISDLLKNGPFQHAALDANLKDDHRGYTELVASDGQVIELRASTLPDGGRVWLCSNVTEQRQLVDRLQQIDRIETLGKVAGDTAHDFGNILSTISAHTHRLEQHQNETSAPILLAISNAVEYGTSLIQRLLAFAKKQHLTPEVVDLNTLIEGMADLIEISLKTDVNLDITYSNAALYVSVDPGQLESALLNLVLNANQAIKDAGSISITIGLGIENTATLTISDTGAGISSDILDRVMEPFFTTRHGEGGTGLGLSIVYGFIRQTGGDLKITSEVGFGTRIEIQLPLATATHVSDAQFVGKTVLLIEDDSQARQHAQKMLAASGFDIQIAANDQTAKQDITDGNFDVIVSDLDLGHEITGWDLIDQFLSANPKKHAIVVSGRLPDHVPLDSSKHSRIHCFSKPLEVGKLQTTMLKIFQRDM